MIERRNERPPVTYTTFQARDLGGDTAELFKTACRDAYERFQPDAMIVGSSCTAELIQDDAGGLARALNLPIPVMPLDLPSYQKKENWGAAETFFQMVRTLAAKTDSRRAARPDGAKPRCNILGPYRPRLSATATTWWRFRTPARRDGCRRECNRPPERHTETICAACPTRTSTSFSTRRLLASPPPGWKSTYGQPQVRTVPIGLGATKEFIREVAELAKCRSVPKPYRRSASRSAWWSRSVDSNYLTRKRVFVFGDATHAIAAARVASEEMGFEVVGLGCYNREFAREVREAAAEQYGLTALITDDYLEVERAIAEAQPELVLGTQMERHIAKRLRIACAVISAPSHVQDFPARYSPQMGFEGANVLFDTWVHPLVMGLEEHLLTMFRDDFEFSDAAGPSHLGAGHSAPIVVNAAGSRRSSPGSAIPSADHLDQRGPGGAVENPLLRARKGAPEHRSLRR